MGVYDFDYPERLQVEPEADTRSRMRMVPWLLAVCLAGLAGAAYGVWAAS